jgi:hypothetical protein
VVGQTGVVFRIDTRPVRLSSGPRSLEHDRIRFGFLPLISLSAEAPETLGTNSWRGDNDISIQRSYGSQSKQYRGAEGDAMAVPAEPNPIDDFTGRRTLRLSNDLAFRPGCE